MVTHNNIISVSLAGVIHPSVFSRVSEIKEDWIRSLDNMSKRTKSETFRENKANGYS